MTVTYFPFVYWAQSKNQVTLKVDLADVKDININLLDKRLQVSAYGQGARGCNNYGFSIDFHEFVIPDESNYKVIDRQIDFTLKKKSGGWWPRLTGQPQKPPWLKIDFDKWKSEDMDDNEYEQRDVCNDYPDMYDKLHKEELGYRKEDFKKVYLIIYNLCQLVGFLYIFTVMGLKYSRDGPGDHSNVKTYTYIIRLIIAIILLEIVNLTILNTPNQCNTFDFMKHTYNVVGNPMKFIQLLQFLEVMHPLFGYTKSSMMISFLDIGGRAFVLFFMIEGEPRMQTKPVVFYLFFIWSAVEVIRYLYYNAQLLNVEIYFLTWLRYTIWIPLYPLGVICEGIIILRNIPYFEETQRFTVSLPNSLNFSLHFPTFLCIYLLVLCIPSIYTVMSHMNHARYKKLGKSNIKRKYT